MDYPTVYQQTSQLLKTNEKKLPDLFCKFVATMKALPTETLPTVHLYFKDMNKRIEEYDEQYQILLHELGVLCSKQQTKADISLVFFQNLLDFFRLAYSVHQDQPETLEKFHSLQQDIQRFLEKGTLTVQGEPLQKALLLQVTSQAWALTSSGKSIESVAKQVGGSLKKQNKHRTRKQKQKQKQKH